MKESRLFSFIDKQSAFTVHYLEGEKLIRDINNVHNIGPKAQEFYREALLSSMQMVNFMKATENMGFYIDSERPYFRFKIEMNSRGTMRTLLLPEDFEDFPENISGKARITKAFPNKQPYASVIELTEEKTKAVVNKMLKESYQSNTEIAVGKRNFSLMYSKLPPSNIAEKFDEIIDIPLGDFISQRSSLFSDLEKSELTEEKDIISFFEKSELSYLGSKEVKFHCPCSKERMVANLLTLGPDDREEVFKERETVEVRCDYCNSIYDLKESDLKRNSF